MGFWIWSERKEHHFNVQFQWCVISVGEFVCACGWVAGWVYKGVGFLFHTFLMPTGDWMMNDNISSWAWPHIMPQKKTLWFAQLGSKGVMKTCYRWGVKRAVLYYGTKSFLTWSFLRLPDKKAYIYREWSPEVCDVPGIFPVTSASELSQMKSEPWLPIEGLNVCEHMWNQE